MTTKNSTYQLLVALFVLAAFSCKEKYEAPTTANRTGFLVVEGVINSGVGATRITLSTSSALSQQTVSQETGATVQVEGENGTLMTLTDRGAGVYQNDQLNLNPSIRYRLRIKRKNGKEYLTDYQAVKVTPVIDSITFRREPSGVDIYVNAHDAQNKTRYYKWDFVQTWEFHSKYPAYLSWKITQRPPPQVPTIGIQLFDSATGGFNEKIFRCWQTSSSTSVLIGSTAKLTEDKVYLPVNHIENGSWMLSELYSIIVTQYALSKQGHEFFERLRKNSETLGTVFDPQPSELNSNLRCVSDPTETVIGYVEVASVVSKRIFIYSYQIPNWNYVQSCAEPQQIKAVPDSIVAAYNAGLLPTVIKTTFPSGAIEYFDAASSICVDCTLRGTNVKPSFWP